MSALNNVDVENGSFENNTEYIRIGKTTFEITSFYNDEISFMSLLKNALQRDAEAVLRQIENS